MTVKEKFEKWYEDAHLKAAEERVTVRLFAERAYRAGRKDALKEMKK